jgi:hypothetical protein
MKASELKIGMTVRVNIGGEQMIAKIEGKGSKNGMRLVTLDIGRWCYIDAVREIITKEAK